jgi:hypothetical protein
MLRRIPASPPLFLTGRVGNAVAARTLATLSRSSSVAPARLLLKNAAQVVTVGGGASPKLGAQMGVVDVLADHSMLVGLL